MVSFLVHDCQVFVAHDLSLPVFDGLLVVLNLSSAHIVIDDHVTILEHGVLSLVVLVLCFLIDETLGGLAKHALLLPVVLELVLVLHATSCDRSDDIVALIKSIALFHIGFCSLLLHCSIQFSAVLPGVLGLCNALLILLSVVSFSLPLNDSAPFIKVTSRICWIVPLIVIRQILQFATLILHWLLHTLRVNSQRIDQVIHISVLF